MALDERYIPLNSLNEFYIDKDTALPLANGELRFYRDSNRSTPKTVYQLSSSGGEYHYVALPNPVSLNSVGTAQNQGGDNIIIYAFPYTSDPITSRLELDLYYLEAYDALGNLQWTREAIPNLTSSTDPTNDSGNAITNQLANPQFTRYFLQDSPTILTLSGSEIAFPIAPDWDLVASGTGIITLERAPVSGNEAIPTSPAYYLKITTNIGVTNPYLRQRFKKNSGLWSGNFIAGTVVARVELGSNSLSMKYQDSSGVNSNITIFDAALIGEWESYGGSVEVGNSSNTQSGEDAFVDIIVEIPTGNIINITSLQVLVTDTALPDIKAYSQKTANREQALMGDYYIPRLEYKNVASLLVGWDFPMNPRQFGTSGVVTGGTAKYICDQTILQTSIGLTVNFSPSTLTNGLSLNHQQADRSYALIQYLDQEDVDKFVGTRLSVNVNGYTVSGANSSAPTDIKVYLFACSNTHKFGILPTTIVNLENDGNVTLTPTAVNDGWYEINRSNLPTAEGTLNSLLSYGMIDKNNDVGFNNWVIDDDDQVFAAVNGIAIVVSFVPAESTTDYETQIDSISVTPGDIPTRPSKISKNITLQECQRYYEMTYESGDQVGVPGAKSYRAHPTLPISPTSTGIVSRNIYPGSLLLSYYTEKRVPPLIKFYSVATAQENRVDVDFISGPLNYGTSQIIFNDYWSPDDNGIGTRTTQYGRLETPLNGFPLKQVIAPDLGMESNVAFHNTIDARIGIDLTTP